MEVQKENNKRQGERTDLNIVPKLAERDEQGRQALLNGKTQLMAEPPEASSAKQIADVPVSAPLVEQGKSRDIVAKKWG